MSRRTRYIDIGPLLGGGVVVGYRCPARCRHCLYGCGPHRRDGGPKDDQSLDEVLDLLSKRAPRAVLHIGGGEPFLNQDLLEKVVEGMARRGLKLDYVETNASWFKNREQGINVLERLARLGLKCLLVSLSPFHAEFVPLSRTLGLIEVAERMLPRGAFVWIPDFYRDLEGYPGEKSIDLDAHIAGQEEGYARKLAARYSLVPAGRTGRFLHDYGERRPFEDFLGKTSCLRRIEDTTHFHVDLDGLYVPGLCSGLVLPLLKLPGQVDLTPYPILRALVEGGPGLLFELATEQGFEPQDSYSSSCDFCGHLRQFLFHQGDYEELGPAGFYDERSLSFEG